MKGILTAFIISAGVCLMVFGSVPTEPPQELQAAAPVQTVSLAEFQALQDEVAELKKQVADFKSCQCNPITTKASGEKGLGVAKLPDSIITAKHPTPAETFTKPADEPPVAKQEQSVLAEPFPLADGCSWNRPTSGSYVEKFDPNVGRHWYQKVESSPVRTYSYGGNCANGQCGTVRGGWFHR